MKVELYGIKSAAVLQSGIGAGLILGDHSESSCAFGRISAVVAGFVSCLARCDSRIWALSLESRPKHRQALIEQL